MADPVVPIEPTTPAEAPATGTGGQPPAPTPTDPGYSNADLKKDDYKDIIANTEEPKAPEDKPAEPEKPAEPTTPEEPEVPLEDVVAQTTKKTVEEIRAQEKADEEARVAAEQHTPTAQEQAAIEWEKKFTADNNRRPTYLEAMNYVKTVAIEDIKAEQAAEAEKKQQEQTALENQRTEENKRLDEVIDDEMEDLYNAGKLTRIKDANNPNDQGVIERKALFAKWAEINAQRAKDGKPQIISATRVYDFHYQKPNAQPPGANAPVAGANNSGVAPSEETKLDYLKDVKGKPWSWFKKA